MKKVSPEEAAVLMEEGCVYLDVRSVPEFEAGHPTGAYNVPLLDMGPGGMVDNPEFLSVVEIDQVGQDYLYPAGEDPASLAAMSALADLG